MKRLIVVVAFVALATSALLAQSSKAPGTKAVKGESNSQVMSELQAMKDSIAAQQKQIDQLQQQLAQRDQVLQQNAQQLQQTQSQLAEAQKAATEAQSKVSALESDHGKLQSDMADVKTTLNNTATQTQDDQKRVSAVESLLGRFRMYGDVRVRYENYTQEKLVTSAATSDLERNRPRIRVRFGIDGKLNQDFVGGFAIATGGADASKGNIFADPTSTNQTLGDAFQRKVIGLDKGYITYNPHYLKGLSITGGKFAATWQKTNQTFDPDVNFDGFSERYSFDVKNSVVKNITVQAMQLFFNERNTTVVGSDRDESWGIGGGLQARLQLGSAWTMTPSYYLVGFLNPNVLVNGLLSNTTNANGTNGTVTVYDASGANPITGAFFAPNGMTNALCQQVQKNGTATPALAPAFCSDFLYSDLILNNQIKTGIARLPLNFLFEYEQNLDAKASNGLGQVIAANRKTSETKKRDKLFQAEISLGQQKNKGDFQFGYAYTHAEQDAVISSWAESDQYQPTNTEQHRVFFNYRVAPNTTLGYTQWIGKYLDFNLVPVSNVKNSVLYRGQLDLIYTF